MLRIVSVAVKKSKRTGEIFLFVATEQSKMKPLNKFSCKVCEKSFSKPSGLAAHERTHTGEKPFKCSNCDKSFSKPSALKKHERTHTGEKPFKCKKCDKNFSRADKLKQHENNYRTHAGNLLEILDSFIQDGFFCFDKV